MTTSTTSRTRRADKKRPGPRLSKRLTGLGRLLTAARGDRTISAMGRLVGVTHATISRWEAGQLEPAIRHLRAISRAYNVTIEQVVDAVTPPLRHEDPPA